MLTVTEVANKLNVSKMTIYRWIVKDKLKAYKMSRIMLRIAEEDLEKFLQERRVKGCGDS